ncbi:MAG: amidotransferase [Pseudomonadales bacterium]
MLLQTDNVLDQFQMEHGDYPAMFAAVLADPDIDVQVVDVREGPPPAGAAEAYVITGSRHSVYDDLPWIRALAEFLKGEIAAGRKVVGICFGHQLLAHFLGGRVTPAPGGWEVGVKATRLHERPCWMHAAPDEFSLLSSHKDQVASLPPEAKLLASSANCPVAGFTLGDNVVTFQGHPEFRKPYSRALMDYRRALLGEAVWAAGIASLAEPTSEVLVSQWIRDFLRG